MKQLTVRTTQRQKTRAVWQRVNPILLPGEIGIESDSGRYKFGDGVTAWNDLGYARSGGEAVNTYTKEEIDAMFGDYVEEVDSLIGGGF